MLPLKAWTASLPCYFMYILSEKNWFMPFSHVKKVEKEKRDEKYEQSFVSGAKVKQRFEYKYIVFFDFFFKCLSSTYVFAFICG